MTPESPAILERLIRSNDLDFMIELFSPRDRAIPHLLEQLDRVASEYHNRIRVPVSFDPEILAQEAERNPHSVRAFLQALGISRSPGMLVMVWRIIQGLSIREVAMNYREQQSFRLIVTLARTGEDPDDLEEYQSSDINDAALVRHFGFTTIDGKPLFIGFFPLSQKWS